MFSSINFWMCFAGLITLVAGVFVQRKEIGAARGWDRLIILGPLFIAVSLAVFAPSTSAAPMRVSDMVPSWMPGHLFWAYFVGCALFAAATSLAVKKFLRLSSTLLGLMFFLFVCMMHIPNTLADPKDRFAWAIALRDISFAGGAWALAGLESRLVAAAIEVDDFVWAHRHWCCDLFCRGIFSSPGVCARLSFPAQEISMARLAVC